MDVPRLLLLLGNLGTGEILFILLLILLLFGAQKIPDLARSLGRAQREFNTARQELAEEPTQPREATEEERVRKAAKDLGIDTNHKSLEELRAAIAERVKV